MNCRRLAVSGRFSFSNNVIFVTVYVLMFLFSGHLLCFLVLHHVFRFLLCFQVLKFSGNVFSLSLSLTQVTRFLFHSCTSSLITSPQYIVSRFTHSLCEILTYPFMPQFVFVLLSLVFASTVSQSCSLFNHSTIVLFCHSLVLLCLFSQFRYF